MTCPKCNAMVAQGAVFCPSCGTGLAAGVAGAQMPPQQMAGTGPVMGGPMMGSPMGHPGMPQYPGGPMMQGGYGYNPYMQPPRTSGMAIAGFVLSLVFCGILGLIFSIMGKNEIQRSGGMVTGAGFATAGIVISIIRIVIEVCYIVFIIAAVSSSHGHF